MAERSPNFEMQTALGESEIFLDVQERISRAAKTNRSVIFIGERGTGKELAAARLHLLSKRWNQPYITLNCAALSPNLIESELFGHEAGAFTGATRLRRGRFELANGGSLFLDEVADIPATAQETILRVVEYGRFERVGGTNTIEADVRLITATNKDLRRLAAEGEFRQDLLDRLSFEVITLPPLRDRREDIPLLTHHFARRMAVELEFEEPPKFSEDAMMKLVMYDWPGNVRELKNVVERMVYRSGGKYIRKIVFDPFENVDGAPPEVMAVETALEVEAAEEEGAAAELEDEKENAPTVMADAEVEELMQFMEENEAAVARDKERAGEYEEEGGDPREVTAREREALRQAAEAIGADSDKKEGRTGYQDEEGDEEGDEDWGEVGAKFSDSVSSSVPSTGASRDTASFSVPSTGAVPRATLAGMGFEETVEELRVQRMRAALQQCKFSQRRAAKSLGLTYDQFRGYYRKYRGKLGVE